MKKVIIGIFIYLKYYFWYSAFQRRLNDSIRVKNGKIKLFEKYFYYHYGLAFYDTYNELFINGIYDFKTDNVNPLIIDCGANMGLSILFYAMKYPNAEIIAFEPDKSVLPSLVKNIRNYNLHMVQLVKKAVWNEDTELNFYTDEGMGGRIDKSYINQEPTLIKAVRLKDYLNRRVHMLKMDIEGAEYIVLKDCEVELRNVDNLFIEYHSFIDEEQHLEDILNLLKRSGFRYHLKESFSRQRPFLDKINGCEKIDMAINIFAYKN